MAGSNCDQLFSLLPFKSHNAFYQACVKANADEGYDSSGNPIPGAQGGTTGGSLFGVPIPGSAWWRHFLFRTAEVVIGVAVVVVGAKALTGSSQTVKVITETGKKVAKKA